MWTTCQLAWCSSRESRLNDAHYVPTTLLDAAVYVGCLLLLLSRARALCPRPLRQRRPRPSALPLAAGPLHTGSTGSPLPGLPVKEAGGDSWFRGGGSPAGLRLLPALGAVQWPDGPRHEEQSTHPTVQGTGLVKVQPPGYMYANINMEIMCIGTEPHIGSLDIRQKSVKNIKIVFQFLWIFMLYLLYYLIFIL